MNSARAREDFKPEWTEDRVFETSSLTPPIPVVVVVMKSNHRTPSYRLLVNFKLPDGRRIPSHQPRFDAKDGVVTMSAVTGAHIADLWGQALAYVKDARDASEAEYQEHKAARGSRDGAPGQRPGLKALAKQDKKKWEGRQAAQGSAPTPGKV